MDGQNLRMTPLLGNFQAFWSENSEELEAPYNYEKSKPYLAIFAFLRRALKGSIETLSMEYALGKTCADMRIEYKGKAYPIELKIKGLQKFYDLHPKDSLEQISSYIHKCGANEGWLVVFDNNPDIPPEEKITWETIQYEGSTIHIVGC
jgi:hypothetical protein